jgi:hypothetical protein
MCGGGDPAWWELFGETDDPAKLSTENRRAIEICAQCPVARECLDEAIEFGDRGVIRAGIAMWMAQERFNCETCGVRDVRSMSKRPPEARKRFCDACRRRLSRPVDPEECGTPFSFRKHLRRGEQVCDVCRDARNDYEADRSKARRRALAAA